MQQPIIKWITVSFLVLNTYCLRAQENKLKFHSISLGAGLATASSDTFDEGYTINSDLSFKLNDHIFSLYFNSGSVIDPFYEIDILSQNEDFYELSLTYGREFELKKWLIIEGHAGMGYFNYKLNSVQESTIGFPIRLKVVFYTGKHFGIGLNPNINLNSLVKAFYGNIIFQYKL